MNQAIIEEFKKTIEKIINKLPEDLQKEAMNASVIKQIGYPGRNITQSVKNKNVTLLTSCCHKNDKEDFFYELIRHPQVDVNRKSGYVLDKALYGFEITLQENSIKHGLLYNFGIDLSNSHEEEATKEAKRKFDALVFAGSILPEIKDEHASKMFVISYVHQCKTADLFQGDDKVERISHIKAEMRQAILKQCIKSLPRDFENKHENTSQKLDDILKTYRGLDIWNLDKKSIEKLSDVLTDQANDVWKLNKESLEKLCKLNQESLEKLCTLNQESLEKVSTLPKDKIENLYQMIWHACTDSAIKLVFADAQGKLEYATNPYRDHPLWNLDKELLEKIADLQKDDIRKLLDWYSDDAKAIIDSLTNNTFVTDTRAENTVSKQR